MPASCPEGAEKRARNPVQTPRGHYTTGVNWQEVATDRLRLHLDGDVQQSLAPLERDRVEGPSESREKLGGRFDALSVAA